MKFLMRLIYLRLYILLTTMRTCFEVIIIRLIKYVGNNKETYFTCFLRDYGGN